MGVGGSFARRPRPHEVKAIVVGMHAMISHMRAAPLDKASARLRAIAAKLLWWKSAEDALADPIRLAGQIMTLGTWDDANFARRELGDDLFLTALRNPPPGVFDARSWRYWNLVFGIRPVPPLPTRRIP